MTSNILSRKIPLSQGKFAIVDAADYDFLMQWKWYFSFKGYATRNEYIGVVDGKKKRKTIAMHSIIAQTPKGMETDHIDRNTLNNTRINLRVCTKKENGRNRVGQAGSSKFKGVSWHKRTGKWRAYIFLNCTQINLGLFLDESSAAQAYNAAATLYFGEFARVNII